jgi:hypothetical protein
MTRVYALNFSVETLRNSPRKEIRKACEWVCRAELRKCLVLSGYKTATSGHCVKNSTAPMVDQKSTVRVRVTWLLSELEDGRQGDSLASPAAYRAHRTDSASSASTFELIHAILHVDEVPTKQVLDMRIAQREAARSTLPASIESEQWGSSALNKECDIVAEEAAKPDPILNSVSGSLTCATAAQSSGHRTK